MPDLIYLTLRDDVGIAPAHIVNDKGLEVPNPRAGELDNLTSIGVQIPMPVMVGDDVAMTTRQAPIHILDKLGPKDAMTDRQGRFCRARILPDSRIVETDHPAVVNLLTAAGYVQCDPPKSEQPRKPQTADTSGEEG